jgi:hypothetical protein
MAAGDQNLVRYETLVYDSARWHGFAHRRGDIVITTPPKCGTTWTQMICALLIFQTPELEQPLAMHSPWLDMKTRARRDVYADLAAQQHRRFIKTHTPLDGLPRADRVTYICVGRDPRDVALSMEHHLTNMNMAGFVAARDRASAIDGDDVVEASPLEPPAWLNGTPRERFWAWALDDTPPNLSGSTLLRTLRHVESFWNAPNELDVVLLHYDDLRTDLEGQMRSLAARLGIEVPEELWPSLVTAATFESMKANADRTTPSPNTDLWLNRQEFFHRGTSGQWRELLDDDDLARYDARVASLVAPDLAAWVHRA